MARRPCDHATAEAKAVTDRWQRPRAAWRDDAEFCAVAELHWPVDYERAQRGGYDAGAAQRLTQRHEGWRVSSLVLV